MVSRLLLALVFCVTLVSSIQVYRIESAKKPLKHDAAALADIRHGLFNTAIWKEIASDLIAERLEDLDLSANRETLEPQVESILESLIDELEAGLEQRLARGPEPGETAWDSFRRGVRHMILDFAVDFDEIRDRTPEFASAILDHLEQPGQQEQLKSWIRAQLDEFLATSLGDAEPTHLRTIVERHGCEDREQCRALLEDRLAALEARERPWWIALAAAGGILLASLVFLRDPSPWTLSFLLATGAALLVTSLFIPMLDIDARIAELRLELMGREIVFRNQVLFFQSKSLFDVVQLLLRSGDPGLTGVSFLLLLFSVAFPATKILLSLAWLVRPSLRGNAPAAFFVLRSGKWSMADVMVVAIFMAYIGFDGIVDDQLAGLAGAGASELVATNGSSLQPGFHLFTAFCLCGLAASQLIQNRTKREAEKPGPERESGLSGERPPEG